MTTPIEQAVIQRAQEGNTDAFRKIVDHYQSFAYAVSFRLLGHVEEAEDVVQEAFIRLWKNLYKYRPEVKLTTWLYRIIANLCLDYLKSVHMQQKKNRVAAQALEGLRSYESADEELKASELNEMIQKAVEELTPKQKAVFILRDLEGLSVEEVCSILSMSAGNLKSNLYYARKQVSGKLKEYYQTTDKITTL